MDKSQAHQMFATLSQELEQLRRKIEDMSRRESGLVKVIEGIEELYPELVPRPEPNGQGQGSKATPGRAVNPRGQEAVLFVLEDAEPNWITIEDIANEIVKRGWSPDSEDPVGATRAATVRLFKKKAITRRKRGRSYAYRIAYSSKSSEALSGTEGF